MNIKKHLEMNQLDSSFDSMPGVLQGAVVVELYQGGCDQSFPTTLQNSFYPSAASGFWSSLGMSSLCTP